MGDKKGLPMASLGVAGFQDGFALASVLWVLAAMTIFASFFSLWGSSAREKTAQAQKKFYANVDLAGTQASLLYLLGTRSLNFAGLTTSLSFGPGLGSGISPATTLFASAPKVQGGEIPLDDTPCSGMGRAYFSIQDEGGLLGLNHPDAGHLENLLAILGVPTPETGPLVDKLLDYLDSDSLIRLNGAEKRDYERQGLPAPANYLLLTPWEARDVLGWEIENRIWKEDLFPRLTTIATGGIPNLNTAPLLVIKALPGMDENAAIRIASARKENPFTSVFNVETAIGKKLFIDPMETRFFPSGNLRITLWHEKLNFYKEIHLNLSTNERSVAPWSIDYGIHVPLTDFLKTIPKESVEIPVFSTSVPPVQQ